MLAGFLGFGGLAGSAVNIAQFCFYIGLILFAGTLVYSLITGKGRPTDLP
jgi:uncharacterized membrane protein YtjA (UPF0391 family)